MKKILSIITALLLLPLSVFAVQITVPSAPSSGYYLVSTSTGAYVATSTSRLNIGSINATSTATSTYAGGINLTGGCFSINNTCVGGSGGSGTVNSGVYGQLGWYASNGTAISATGTQLTIGNILATSTATSSFAGNVNISGAVQIGCIPTYSDLTLAGLNVCGNVDNYFYAGVQNKNPGTSASTDFILSNNLTTTLTYYTDFGQNSSNYTLTSFPAFQRPNQTYLYNTDDAITIATASTTNTLGAFISFVTGGVQTSNEAMRIISNQNVGIGTTSPYSKLSVAGQTVAAYFTATTSQASTFPYASSTSITSSGSIYGAGLTTCNSATSALTWVNGVFGCNIITGGGGGSGGGTWSTTTSQVAGRLVNYPNNTTDIPTIGSNSTTTAKFFFDPNTQVGYVSGKLGIASSSPISPLSVVGNVDIYGTYMHTGTVPSINATYCTYGKQCLGYFGNDNTTSGVGMSVENYNKGANAYANYMLGNDLMDSGGLNVAYLSYQSSVWNNTSFGTDLNVPNALQLANPLGPVQIIAASTSVASGGGNIQFITGGTSGSERARITTAGNLGIGTTSPFTKLGVAGTITANNINATGTTASTLQYASSTALSVNGFFYVTGQAVGCAQFGTAGALVSTGSACGSGGGGLGLGWASSTVPNSNSIYSLQSENVGIGSSSPIAKLGINMNPNDIFEPMAFAIGSTTAANVNSSLFMVLNTGNVGIGSTTPKSRLSLTLNGSDPFVANSFEISSTTAAGVITKHLTVTNAGAVQIGSILNTNTINQNGFSDINIQNNSGGGTNKDVNITGLNVTGSVRNAGNFRVIDENSRNIFNLMGTGNLGIGTTTPNQKLFVVGTALALNFTATSTTATTTLPGPLTFGSSGTSPTVGTTTLVGGTKTITTGAVTSNSIIFLTTKVLPSGPVGNISYTVSNGSFTINSDSGIDNRDIAWMVINQQ